MCNGDTGMLISPVSSNPSTVPPQWLPFVLLAVGDPSPLPSPPSPSPPPECAKVQLTTGGWQMLSFNCIGNMSNTFEVLETAPWNTDDKIITRDPFLKFATFNGERFVGGLVNHDQLHPSLGYHIYHSGAEGATFVQSGLPQLPVEAVVLRPGWNWIGHAPLTSYGINTGITAVSSFTVDDQIKTRSGSHVRFTTYDGSTFQGGLYELNPGIGYMVKVAQQTAFRYTASLSPPSPSPPPPSPPSPSPPPPSPSPPPPSQSPP